MNIIKNTGTHATSSAPGRTISYIVIHYTAGVTSKPGTAMSTANWFKNSSAGGSADFVVDDENIVQYNGDIKNRYCWAVGGSKYSKMSTSLGGKLYGIARNVNCISIEICSCKKNTKSLQATDTDWYFTDKAIAKALELTKYLMTIYKINIDHVIMHHQVTGKICPNPWVVNESRLSQWNDFKKALGGKVTTTQVTQTTKTSTSKESNQGYKVKVTADSLNIRKEPNANSKKLGEIKKGEVYTIVKTDGKWGYLKSGAGWIHLGYTKQV